MSILNELIHLQEQHGWLSEANLRELAQRLNVPRYRLQGLVSFYPHFRTAPPAKVQLHLCRDLACHLAGGSAIGAALKQHLAPAEGVELKEVSCLGRCDLAPAATLNEAPLCLDDPQQVIRKVTDATNKPVKFSAPSPSRLVSSVFDPSDRCQGDPYGSAQDRYAVLRRVCSEADGAERAIEVLKQSGLRGMGGAGFPTGLKWELVRNQPRHPKYVIVNADESEPGTFKDRVILERLPYLVIEGTLIAAHVVGARRAIVYLRHEYRPEREIFEAALEDAEQRQLLTRVTTEVRGLGIRGHGPESSDPQPLNSERIEVQVFVSPGGYILGEETALLEALEDKRGEPRNKPPFPGTYGLWGQPTLINNVETLAHVPAILHHGAEWWKAQGRPPYEGLKFMSVCGHVEKPGVYEIAMGTTVSELIARAGGVSGGRSLKAFAPGGASSNFLPAEHVDASLDFKAMQEVGSMLGSGALVVVAEGTDMLQLAANVVRFFRNESCGKCVPCRVGTQKAVEMLENVVIGGASAAVLETLPELAETLQLTSICGLGQVALNPILSVLKFFPEEASSPRSEAGRD